jgi:Na+-translocating ferredoxin:NAD+ oxidoreductase RnfE subunit
MLGGIFLLVIAWLVFAFGTINKADKFWSYELIGPTVWVAVMGIVALLDNSPQSDLTLREILRMVIGLTVGLTVVIVRRNEFEKKRSTIAAGITHLLMGFGFTLLALDTARWLNR